jgi:hypothetical protein
MRRLIYCVKPWTVEQDPTAAGNDRLVRFSKHNGQRKLLDRIAEWHPEFDDGPWNPHRWVPRPPAVPQQLLAQVEGFMREVAT